MKKAILTLIIFLVPLNALADEVDSTKYPLRIIPLPSIGYTPETKLTFGAAALGQFKLRGSGEETRSSNIITFGTYTLNKQYQIKAEYTVFFPQEKYLSMGELDFLHFPEKFWGIGTNTKDDDEVFVEYTSIIFSQSFYKRFGPHLFTGPRFRYVRQFNVSFETLDEEPIEFPDVIGSTGHTALAIGWGMVLDKRNSVLTPSRGYFFEMNSFVQRKNAGSTYSLSKIEMDARRYLDLLNDHNTVLAFQFRSVHTFGDVPFREMPLLGGRLMMRGMYEGRYRDHHLIATQTEMRQHLFWRIGMVAFAAVGNVGETLSDTFDTQWKWTGGGGIKFNIGKEEKTNIRLDFGMGRGMSGLYITFGEAF